MLTKKQFLNLYPTYIIDIEKIVHPDWYNIITELKSINIEEHICFVNKTSIAEFEARGIVWSLFIEKVILNKNNYVSNF